jgi:sugar phosphate isomerase/epimerase
MNLSLSNGIFSKYTLEENLKTVRSLGFENLEFNMKSVKENDEASVYTARDYMNILGLRCLTLHAATLHIRDEKEISRANYYNRVSADFAETLSSKVMVVHSNVSKKLPRNVRNNYLEKIFKELINCSQNSHFKLALENLSYSSNGFGKNVAELKEILETANDDDVGITLDFCHAEATGETENILEEFHKKILNVHISARAHEPFQAETKTLKAFISSLKSCDYEGPLTIELNSKCTIDDVTSTKSVLEKLIVEQKPFHQ